MEIAMMETGTVPILMGTTAIKLVGVPYYGKLMRDCHGAVIPLPMGGMMHIPAAARQLAPILEQFRDDKGILRLICHSQGALIGMLHADAHPNTRVLSFGGPHRGAPSAQLMGLFPRGIRRMAPALRDMSPHSYFMQRYAEVLARSAHCLTSVGTTHDWIVPHHSSYVVGARNVLIVADGAEQLKYERTFRGGVEVKVVPHVGHIWSVMNKHCIDFARDFVNDSHLQLVSA
jgi:pimeloyl-ACP methyl ester carboxylesterase